jgi:hypothetical protein
MTRTKVRDGMRSTWHQPIATDDDGGGRESYLLVPIIPGERTE